MRIPFVLFLALLFFTACDSNSEPEELTIESITFKPGQVRTYEQDLITTTFDDDGNVLDRTEERLVYVVENKGESESVPEIEGTIQVDVQVEGDPDGLVASDWYTKSDSQLVHVAYRGGLGNVTLKDGRSRFVERFQPFSAFYPERLTANEITVREFPRVVFEFPLEEGRRWESLRDPRFNLLITGEVLPSERVETPAGTFFCQVVKTTHTFSGGTVEMFHYFTEEGLVQRIDNSGDATFGGPVGQGQRMYERTVVLVDVSD